MAIGWITGVFTFLVILTVFQQISIDTWIKSAFTDKDKGKAGLSQTVGLSLGTFFGADLFLLLNSQKWIDSNLNFLNFFDNKSVMNKVTHTDMMLILAFITFLMFIYLLFFTSEPKIGSQQVKNEPNFCEIITSTTPKFFKNGNNLLLIGYVLYTNFFLGLLSTSTQLQFIKEGFLKTDIATINAICIPIKLFGGLIIGVAILKQGYYMREFHLMMYIRYIAAILSILLVAFYFSPKNYESSFWVFLGIQVIQALANSSGAYYFAFVVQVADPKIGATAISIFQSLSNFSYIFASTVALWLLEYLNFGVYGTIISCIAIVNCFITFPIAFKLDKMDAKE